MGTGLSFLLLWYEMKGNGQFLHRGASDKERLQEGELRSKGAASAGNQSINIMKYVQTSSEVHACKF